MSTIAGDGRQRARGAQHVEPRRAGQVLVGQHEIEAALVHEIDRLFGGGGGGHAVAAAPQRLAQHGQHDRLVVDDQHLVARGDDRRVRRAASWSSAMRRTSMSRWRRRVAGALGGPMRTPWRASASTMRTPSASPWRRARRRRRPPGPEGRSAERAAGRRARRRRCASRSRSVEGAASTTITAAPGRARARLGEARVESSRRPGQRPPTASGCASSARAPGGARQLGVAQHDDRRVAPRVARPEPRAPPRARRRAAASSARMPAKAFSTSSPRVRERRNPASRLTCARSSASTSGSGRGSTAATSRPNACAAAHRIALG